MTAPSTNSSPPRLQLDALIAEYWNSSCELIEFAPEHPRMSIPVPLKEGREPRGEEVACPKPPLHSWKRPHVWSQELPCVSGDTVLQAGPESTVLSA